VLQLLPELAGEVADSDSAVFQDASADCEGVALEPVPEPDAPRPLTHVSRPSELWLFPGYCTASKAGRFSAASRF
jgi:hypothetical protein